MIQGIEGLLAEADERVRLRGEDYYARGLVKRLVRAEGGFEAEVAGSEREPYAVSLYLGSDGSLVDCECTCPFEASNVCKHVVAALLALRDGGETVKPPKKRAEPERNLELLVCEADKHALAALVLDRASQDAAFRRAAIKALGPRDGGRD